MKTLLLAIAALKIVATGASAYAVTPSEPADHEVKMVAACPFCFPEPPPDNC